MTQKINEPIEVLVKFHKTTIFPSFFKWRNRTYRVEKVNLVHHLRDGENKIYYFSVSDNLNFFRLAFSTNDLSWKMEELYSEG
ncbi:MAG: hypothetical protein UT48_C0001G0015 [Parcubacteria group bacterium GW2011_GWE2_39_37]|uniref:Uncharacterized protein n=1 Tax=Candidatus Falkowbacteria bacterium GW2011_GWF2_39_8 TaxID=1618642 RepID=A0A0G0PYJ5_9BACT|nr:MAG: hypothetical protein UT48_C0001G0015 [Parcubacteria group bacterium GW2011_GWE2_39_37]KKR33214.1 MAG: hypothetical protein UT64_C0012G0006 [Candidatus Falkowbacteria bacterium GW2011_GWF2_39_8]